MKNLLFRIFFLFFFFVFGEERKLKDVALCLSAFFACTKFLFMAALRENGGMYIFI